MNATRQSMYTTLAPDRPFQGGLLQRKCACGNHTTSGSECAKCAKRDKVQRKASEPRQGNEVPEIVYDVLQSPGEPLDNNTRRLMESWLGQDFGNVRLHTDSRAAASAQSVDALAYTVGNNVVFGQ